ncbi:anti-sigma regulatory factor (Ser/Thr protein kinase) [Actinomadura pelletieri DSM 43383]|uniref:Anti-sigma regulatory factor (Ser/Thr protein kinase) n=1 Tax=Actinomadura pelletieri DSM 43383 TaxID=1120940 RepID=A0A495QY23_9ACTN|nr:ATP-binding protein [Actinomadura pelletieri]RKS79109.1 anti-sigma regulatory factor (Ser/Thr protein kinase) [Actinomadura pelletieri DSM 43383]
MAREGLYGQRRMVKGSLRLETEMGNVSVGRQWLRDVLDQEFGVGRSVTDDAVQALSEVLTNAILYGTGRYVRVTYLLDGEWAEVAVHNDRRAGGVFPRKQSPAPDAECGRGLELVEAFCEQWGITALPGDAVKVWFKVRFT